MQPEPVLFYLNLWRHSLLRQVVDSDLLLCTGFNVECADLLQCLISTLRQTNDEKTEPSNYCFDL